MKGSIEPIIYIAIALFAMAFLLFFVTDKIWATDGSINRLIHLNDPIALYESGAKNYYKEDFDLAVDRFKRIVEKSPEFEGWEKAKLMLALSKAAAHRSDNDRESVYSDVVADLDELIKAMEKKSMDPSTVARIAEVKSFMESGYDPALAEWKCCDFKSFGYIYAFGVCGQVCRYESCPPGNCNDIPWSADLR